MRVFIIALLALSSFSCASIMDGRSHDTIPISSKPQGATVVLDGVPVGETPMQAPATAFLRHGRCLPR